MMKRYQALFYREYYKSKKNLVISGGSIVIMVILCLLTLLSFKFGNLKMIISEKPELREILYLYIRYFPVLMLAVLPMNLEVEGKNTKTKSFLLSLPTTGIQFSLAKHSVIGAVEGVALLLSFVWGIVFNTLTGGGLGISSGFAAVVLISILVFSFLHTIMQFFMILTGSYDIAGLCMLAVILPVFMLLSKVVEKTSRFQELSESLKAANLQMGAMFTDLERLAGEHIGVILAVFILLHIVSILMLTWALERREK